jgi:hypothetical protein
MGCGPEKIDLVSRERGPNESGFQSWFVHVASEVVARAFASKDFYETAPLALYRTYFAQVHL